MVSEKTRGIRVGMSSSEVFDSGIKREAKIYDGRWKAGGPSECASWGTTTFYSTAALRIKRARRLANGPLLDIGCGDGGGLSVVQSILSQAVIGIDVSSEGLKASRDAGISVARASPSGLDLPFRDNVFATLTAFEVIEHLLEPLELLREAYRVLQTGGVLAITTPNLVSWYNRVLIGMGFQPVNYEISFEEVFDRPFWKSHGVQGHIRIFTPNLLKKAIKLSGFKEVRVHGIAYGANHVPRLLRVIDSVAAVFPSVSSHLLAIAIK
jgi:ubiquinone/menaquinone biosynthesis C-methylase UbiE